MFLVETPSGAPLAQASNFSKTEGMDPNLTTRVVLGKTSLARIIARSTGSTIKELSATSSGTADVRALFEEAKNTLQLTGKRTVMFVGGRNLLHLCVRNAGISNKVLLQMKYNVLIKRNKCVHLHRTATM